jgi:hypothetical protein
MILCTYQSIFAINFAEIAIGSKNKKTGALPPEQTKISPSAKISSGMLQSSTKAWHTQWNYIQSQLEQLQISLPQFIAKLTASTPELLQKLSSLQNQLKHKDSISPLIEKIVIDINYDFDRLQRMQNLQSKKKKQQIETITQDIIDKIDLLNYQKNTISDKKIQKKIAEFQATFEQLLSADHKQQRIESRNAKLKDTTSLELKESDGRQDAPAKTTLDRTSNYIQSQWRQLHISIQEFIAKLVQSTPELLQQLSTLQRQQKKSDVNNTDIQKDLTDMQKKFVTLQRMQSQPAEYSPEQIQQFIQNMTHKLDDLNKYTTSTSDQHLKKNIENFQATFQKLLPAHDKQQMIESKNVTPKNATSLDLVIEDTHHDALVKSIDQGQES